MADTYGVIIVMPDGGFDSWYYDSPVEPTYRYETFVARELVEYIDSHYRTKAEPSARAIAGLSMGGHGALYLAIRHQNVFGAAGSLSGGVDIRPFPDNWNIAKRLGTLAEHPDNWERNTVINMIDQINPDSLKIIFDCGTEDFFYEVNCAPARQAHGGTHTARFLPAPGRTQLGLLEILAEVPHALLRQVLPFGL